MSKGAYVLQPKHTIPLSTLYFIKVQSLKLPLGENELIWCNLKMNIMVKGYILHFTVTPR